MTVQDGVKGVSLDSSEKTVRVGSSLTLIPIFNPVTAFNKAMTWKTSNSNIKIEAAGSFPVRRGSGRACGHPSAFPAAG